MDLSGSLAALRPFEERAKARLLANGSQFGLDFHDFRWCLNVVEWRDK
jgi:hypothetical protein